MLNGMVIERQGKQIVIVNVSEVLNNAFGTGYQHRNDVSMAQEAGAVRRFCHEANFAYYAQTGDLFSIYAAADHAIGERKYGVVVEQLS